MWNQIDVDKNRNKSELMAEIGRLAAEEGLTVVDFDLDRPWGGYFRIDEAVTDRFLDMFFADVSMPAWMQELKVDPKLLVVAPERRLSWQYHQRRGEVWVVVKGPVGVFLSPVDDHPAQPEVFHTTHTVEVPVGYRHRLVGLDSWGIVAEIWVHTDPTMPSDESEIIRLQDDFGRN